MTTGLFLQREGVLCRRGDAGELELLPGAAAMLARSLPVSSLRKKNVPSASSPVKMPCILPLPKALPVTSVSAMPLVE